MPYNAISTEVDSRQLLNGARVFGPSPSITKPSDYELNLDSQDIIDELESINMFRNKTKPLQKAHQEFFKKSIPTIFQHVRNIAFETRLSGWRAGVAFCLMTDFGTLVINFVLLVWAVGKHSVTHGYAQRHPWLR
ncbi:hypothetical protein BP5796_12759 [Coleophoma crateriformis]|uniref:Uncharacterized protein n=1 Tax=Coleophoma crateriformis TaxID=565419 RepID=A0A3D8Q677_9HELO|nr:hypothetical protein BP5796_12759 [Coleophoma crateriformis]